MRIAGTSLYSQLDFKGLEDEINRIIRNQEANQYLGVTIDSTENKKGRVYATAYAIGQGAQKSTSALLVNKVRRS